MTARERAQVWLGFGLSWGLRYGLVVVALSLVLFLVGLALRVAWGSFRAGLGV